MIHTLQTQHVLLIGKGEIEDLLRTLGLDYERIDGLYQAKEGDVVVIDKILKPREKVKMEREYGIALYDRYDIILFLFEAHASPLGKAQIRLAQLQRMLSIATGDKEKLVIKGSIRTVKRKIKKLQETKTQSLKNLREMGYFIIPLVGYTNAGKSTLFNLLIGREKSEVKNELFTTSIVRTGLVDIGIKAILVDTVGFISNVPKSLVPAYKTTLDSLELADLVLHIIDGSDPKAKEKAALGKELIEQKTKANVLIVINKKDLGINIDGDVYISAKNRDLDNLLIAIRKRLPIHTCHFTITYKKTSLLNHIPGSIKKVVEKHNDGLYVKLVGKREAIEQWTQKYEKELTFI